MPRHRPSPKAWLAHYGELIAAWRRNARIGDEAQDAMHDAVLRLLEGGAMAADNPRAYLRRSTRNGMVDRYRREALLPMQALHELDEAEHPLVEGPDADAAANRMVDDLRAALQELPLACQQVYVRHRLEGWTHAEIALAMGLSRAMVEKHMTRALQHLNRRLQKYAP